MDRNDSMSMASVGDYESSVHQTVLSDALAVHQHHQTARSFSVSHLLNLEHVDFSDASSLGDATGQNGALDGGDDASSGCYEGDYRYKFNFHLFSTR